MFRLLSLLAALYVFWILMSGFFTPFLLAARTADAELMRVLAALGADPQLANEDHTTPLMVAAGVGTAAPGEDHVVADRQVRRRRGHVDRVRVAPRERFAVAVRLALISLRCR